GFDADSAKVSALMESIETWHAEHIEHPLRRDSCRSLAKSVAVADPTQLPRYEGSSLRLDHPYLWIEGYDLIGQEPVWVPYEAVTLNCASLGDEKQTFC